jgi:hypothetical protein
MTVAIDRWLRSDLLALIAAMNLSAVWGATQPLGAWETVNPVIVWSAIAATALTLLTYREVVL